MENTYFAAKESDKAAQVLMDKAEHWFRELESNSYLNKLRDMWSSYHGAYYTDTGSGHRISFAGEQGEIVNIGINHMRNLGTHIINMITATRPAMQARSTNTDYKSLVQTNLANGLLDYYLREKRLEKYLKSAVESAVVLGAGFIKMEWNALSGEIYDYNEETKTPIYEGDVQFSNLSVFDVIFDSSKESQNHDWVLCRSFKNKFDLAAKYPELAEKIKNLPTKTDLYKYRFDVAIYATTEDVPVYEFYHKKTESMPDGRYMLFVDTDMVLVDVPMPYRALPIFRLAPADIMGTPYGYTPLFDILPIQDLINSSYSTVATNQNAFGVQNIYVPRGADIVTTQLAGGLNVIEGNAQAGKPEPLNLTQTPAEIFKFIQMLETAAETISGVNSVARGNPESSLKSGSALAMVQSQALQFVSGLQQSYVMLIEDVGTGLINMLKDFANVPRIATIVGKSNRTFMKEFSGDDLSSVNRVIVDVGNPLARSTAGRMQLAENLVQYGLIKNPQQYLTIINTGSLDAMTEDSQHEIYLIRAENEKLVSNEPVIATAIDDHPQHIKEHKSVLGDPDLRTDNSLVQRTLAHIQEHIDLMRSTDPDLLNILGIQPLGPQGGSPANQPSNQPNAPQNAGAPMEQPLQGQQGIEQQGNAITAPGTDQTVNLPKIPNPPQIPER